VTITVACPADGRAVGSVEEYGAEEVAAVVAAARAAQPAWEALSIRDRVRWLSRYRDWLLDNQDRLAELLQAETGKAWPEAALEPAYALEVLNYYSARAPRFLADETPRPHSALVLNKRQRLSYRPYPLVGVITPWNFPLALAMMDALPALLAGASVLLKPSELTPLATRAAVAGWAEIGAPSVLHCVTGAGETGAALVDSVDFVQFTGSTRVGRAVAVRAAERLIPCGLELGGKDPMIVLEDADVERAATGAVWGALFNSGQACVSVERVYVEAGVYPEFVELVVRKVAALRQGVPGRGDATEVGAMANQHQLEIVERHVRDAIERGATVLTGGKRLPHGTFFEPTVLVDVDHSMLCMTEETFGPTIPIMKVRDVDEAVRLANDSHYGLSASVWTRSEARAREVTRRLDVGAVNINDVMANLLALPLPHAGWKQSGLGARNGGAHGIRKYCRRTATTSNRITARTEPQWYPYRRWTNTLIHRALRFVAARDLRRRLR
jgi:acyl-CoA reductase-like NAD-dependent aldehyde dehydrogenase